VLISIVRLTFYTKTMGVRKMPMGKRGRKRPPGGFIGILPDSVVKFSEHENPGDRCYELEQVERRHWGQCLVGAFAPAAKLVDAAGREQ
jgi:hypothetical protein